ncbi:hypothetical protein KAM398_00540 [Acinetobacter sp. KAM398]|uniref:hypothetical protein n=1 Tax=unclassified Acinetobacter TaxID=196816 RepID=UPI001F35A1E4|nr:MULTISPECIES: hypothetical protein [unclassified Acinetobacter]GJC30075.1 hypothetical protein KAM392_00540 [Acinetobacter sp. KAM392]GJC32885.1 hypothetical protein KAM393_00540 [Acinetobacter sp. KAM393]GJC35714.1 hypothetical protein KAM394_00540 [Acinetobacter sp. KAM394]GJC38711.1 hypothetical protein KAM395_02320 [Acinetobacter sp. KAM395]GJC41536.1 hypothetical protein KAM396_02330 [Acinetobacter sp. KAM396]
MSQSEQQAPAKKPSLKKMIFLASLGLLIPIFLVSMAFLAVNSDAKNQEKYKQQQAEIIVRIEAREAAEQQAKQASQIQAASEATP